MVKRFPNILIFLLCSCLSFSSEDEKLQLAREVNYSQALRLDGYYFTSLTGKEEELRTIYFLYQNGIIATAGTVPISKLNYIEKLLTAPSFLQKLRSIKDSFGVYQISGREIQFEMWYPGPGPPKLVFLRRGQILNDSTFHISQISSATKGSIQTVNELYHFKKFHSKPDSTNEFIE